MGRRNEIRSIARSLGEELSPEQIVDAQDDLECAARSVALIREGKGDILIKGMLQTGTLLKAVVHRETGIRASQVMSHVAILDVPRYHKLLFITDGGMVVAPNLEQKGHILKNAVDFCRFLGYERPKAAALCAVETVNPAMPETGDALSLKEAGERGEFGPCIVEGPISLDLATDREAALVKGYHSPGGRGRGHSAGPRYRRGQRTGQSPIWAWPAARWPESCWERRSLSPSIPVGPRRRRNITLSCSAPPWIRRKLTCPTRS